VGGGGGGGVVGWGGVWRLSNTLTKPSLIKRGSFPDVIKEGSSRRLTGKTVKVKRPTAGRNRYTPQKMNGLPDNSNPSLPYNLDRSWY